MLLLAILNALICFMQIAPVPLLYIAATRPDLLPQLSSPASIVHSTIGFLFPTPSVMTVDATPSNDIPTVLPSQAVVGHVEYIVQVLDNPMFLVLMVSALIMMILAFFAYGVMHRTRALRTSNIRIKQAHVESEPPPATSATVSSVNPVKARFSSSDIDAIVDAAIESVKSNANNSDPFGPYVPSPDANAEAGPSGVRHDDEPAPSPPLATNVPLQSQDAAETLEVAPTGPEHDDEFALPPPLATNVPLQPQDVAEALEVAPTGPEYDDGITFDLATPLPEQTEEELAVLKKSQATVDFECALGKPLPDQTQEELAELEKPQATVDFECAMETPLPQQTAEEVVELEKTQATLDFEQALANPLPHQTDDELAELDQAEPDQASAVDSNPASLSPLEIGGVLSSANADDEDNTADENNTVSRASPAPVLVKKTAVLVGRSISDSIWANSIERPIPVCVDLQAFEPELTVVDEGPAYASVPTSPTAPSNGNGVLVHEYQDPDDEPVFPSIRPSLITRRTHRRLLNPLSPPFVPGSTTLVGGAQYGQPDAGEYQYAQETHSSPTPYFVEDTQPPQHSQPEDMGQMVYYETGGDQPQGVQYPPVMAQNDSPPPGFFPQQPRFYSSPPAYAQSVGLPVGPLPPPHMIPHPGMQAPPVNFQPAPRFLAAQPMHLHPQSAPAPPPFRPVVPPPHNLTRHRMHHRGPGHRCGPQCPCAYKRNVRNQGGRRAPAFDKIPRFQPDMAVAEAQQRQVQGILVESMQFKALESEYRKRNWECPIGWTARHLEYQRQLQLQGLPVPGGRVEAPQVMNVQAAEAPKAAEAEAAETDVQPSD